MLIRLGAAHGQVVAIADARDILRAPQNGDDDEVILALMASETRRYEDFTRRVILPVEMQDLFVRFCDCLPLSGAPIAQVTAVEYADADGNVQTLSPQDWRLVGYGDGAAVLVRRPFPVTASQPWPVSVTYMAGPDDTDPPYIEPLDQTNIMRMVARAYDTGDLMPEEEMRNTMSGRRRLA